LIAEALVRVLRDRVVLDLFTVQLWQLSVLVWRACAHVVAGVLLAVANLEEYLFEGRDTDTVGSQLQSLQILVESLEELLELGRVLPRNLERDFARHFL
jgi:hypothetical protein